MTHSEPWQVYAENGEPVVGYGETRDGFTDDLIMGSSHVWLWRRNSGKVEILLQRRALTKKTWPGYYDISAAGHIDISETPLKSAVRETREELGLTVDPEKLIYIFSLRTPLVPNEIDHVYLHEVGVDFMPSFDDGEVDAIEWLTIDTLKQWAANPDQNNLVNQGRGYFGLFFEYIDQL
jgi:isopentenyldiphosphate isomerase